MTLTSAYTQLSVVIFQPFKRGGMAIFSASLFVCLKNVVDGFFSGNVEKGARIVFLVSCTCSFCSIFYCRAISSFLLLSNFL